MSTPRSGLGRGLAALLPDAAGVADGGSLQLPVDQIRPNPFQPRREFAVEALQELADSIQQHGVVQPITVRQAPDGAGFQVVAGERRLRAAKLAGLPTVPAILRPCGEREMLEIALLENVQREDLNPIEAAHAYQRCLQEFDVTQEELARRLGKSRAAVANTLRLLKLTDAIQEAIGDGRLSEGHGRALLSLADPAEQERLATRILVEGLNVRAAERLARNPAPTPRREPTTAGLDPDLAQWQDLIQRALGTKVEIQPGSGGQGRIVVHYFGSEDLARLAEALGG